MFSPKIKVNGVFVGFSTSSESAFPKKAFDAPQKFCRKATNLRVGYSNEASRTKNQTGEKILKIIFALSFCLLFCPIIFGQSVETDSENSVAEISLARDDGKGNASEGDAAATSVFATTDVPLHCSLRLVSTKAVNVKMNIVAVSGASNLKAGKNVVTASYKTNGKQNGVGFEASPAGDVWVAGKYRVDILLDGRLAKSLDFEMQKSAKEIETEKFRTPIKPKATAKQKRKSRKG